MRRLICAFVVRIWHKQVFSWRGSFDNYSIFFLCALTVSHFYGIVGAVNGRNVADCDGTACGYSVCANGGTCAVTSSFPRFNCTCSDHHYGDRCEHPIECQDLNCGNAGICRQFTAGNYGCSCLIGWSGLTCQTGKNFCNCCNRWDKPIEFCRLIVALVRYLDIVKYLSKSPPHWEFERGLPWEF